ncbi:hypothetical protein [Microcoleus vaginatus]|uniref:hypothetical protein n=1 Tax=Microcoleus vaginatus TaxID=119532 RepID=UPI0032A574E3
MLAGKFGDTLGEGSSATDSVTDVTDVSPMSVGRRKKEEGRKIISNAQCPMPNTQFPMPNAQYPIPQSKIQNLKSKIEWLLKLFVLALNCC